MEDTPGERMVLHVLDQDEALGASVDPASFRALMDANRWWFALAQCTDGTYYYQPNRDNAGYGGDSRMTASSVTAFMLLIPKRGLVMTGKGVKSALRRRR